MSGSNRDSNMTIDLNKFKSQIFDKGVLRTQYFDVAINIPNYLKSEGITVRDVINVRCEATALPGIDLIDGYNGPRYGYGPQEYIPYNVGYRPINFTFIIDEGSIVQTFFLRWMNSIVNFNNKDGNNLSGTVNHAGTVFGTYEVGFKDDYSTNIDITVYKTSGEVASTVKLYRAFPISISDIQLAWGDNDQIAKLVVPITFKDFEYNKTTSTLETK